MNWFMNLDQAKELSEKKQVDYNYIDLIVL